MIPSETLKKKFITKVKINICLWWRHWFPNVRNLLMPSSSTSLSTIKMSGLKMLHQYDGDSTQRPLYCLLFPKYNCQSTINFNAKWKASKIFAPRKMMRCSAAENIHSCKKMRRPVATTKQFVNSSSYETIMRYFSLVFYKVILEKILWNTISHHIEYYIQHHMQHHIRRYKILTY